MPAILDLTCILTPEDIEQGYKRLRKKKKYKDVRDSTFPARYISVEEREENVLKRFLDSEVKTKQQRILFYESLSNFKLDPYSAYAISKGAGKGFRPLLVPSPKDRLVFDALLPKYYDLLRGSLERRKLLGIGLVKNQRVSDILQSLFDIYISKGYCYALAIDYSAFFSNLDREILFKKMRKDYGQIPLVEILPSIICNSVKDGEAVSQKTGIDILNNGIPQGLTFSPLLACYYALDIDDIYLANKDVVGYRYIDDIVLYGKTDTVLTAIFKKIEKKSERLKMKPHPLGKVGSKTELKNLAKETITFLGVDISLVNGLHISDRKYNEFVEIVRDQIFPISVLQQKPSEKIKGVYYNFVRGWLNHYEKISTRKEDLYAHLDTLVYRKYFIKKPVRKKFYKKNPWIIISGNSK